MKKIYFDVEVCFHFNENECKSTNLIYLLKFPNDKYYVGQTTNKYGLAARIRQHCGEAFNATVKTNHIKNNIIKKYKKIDVFILHKCNIDEIDFYETFYINILKRKIINIESGGHLSKKLSTETKEKIRKSHNDPSKKKNGKVEVYNLDGSLFKTFDNTSDAAKYFNSNANYMYRACIENFNYKVQYQFKWEKSNKEIKNFAVRKNDNNKLKWDELSITINGEKIFYKKLYKYNDRGYLLEEVNVFELTEKEINGIRSSIKHNTFYKDYFWSLEKHDKIDVPKKRYEKVSEKKSKPIFQLDDDLNIIKEWRNITEASKEYKLFTSNITDVCRHSRKHAGNFVWCYANEYENFKKNWNTPIHRIRTDTIKGRKELGLE